MAIECSEDVYLLDVTDISVTAGTASNLAGSGSSYTFDVYADGTGERDVTMEIVIPQGVCEDVSLDPNDESNTIAVRYDTIPPQLTFFSVNGDPTDVTPVLFRVEWSEPVLNFGVDDLVATGGTLQNFTVGISEQFFW
jgi:hypothetical protein